MIVTRITVKNWRNFRHFEVPLRERQFIVGPNASGKSNFLDIFRFLRDIAKQEGGGLQKAIKDRGGISKVRCLSARSDPEISIDVSFGDSADGPQTWRYDLGIRQETRGSRLPYVSRERVWKNDEIILDRPKPEDKADPARLTQTFLEQIGANAQFREVGRYLRAITYLHLVPQLLRFADQIQGRIVEDDPFGQSFLERVAKTSDATRASRLKKVETALRIAVPQLKELHFTRDETGRPHLQAISSHWRPRAGLQQEDQFSDGTLRLIGVLWTLLEGESLLLLEEPELSLNVGIVSQIAPLIHRLQRPRRRQVLVSTHSEALLMDPGIDGREVLVLTPTSDGTRVEASSNIAAVRKLLTAGMTVGEAVLPRTRPPEAAKLTTTIEA